MKLIKQVFGDNHFVKIFYNVFVAHCTSPSSNSYFPNCSTYWNLFNYLLLTMIYASSMNVANVFDEGKFLLPIFTMGKFFERDGKRLLPLAIQVHHAVCDGYHVGVFVEKLQGYIDQF